EDILVDVIRARKWGDARSRALSYLPGQVCMALKNVYRLDRREVNWRMSPADHEALRAALLHPARPPGASGGGRGGVPTRTSRVPSDAGIDAAKVALHFVGRSKAALCARGDRRGWRWDRCLMAIHRQPEHFVSQGLPKADFLGNNLLLSAGRSGEIRT